MPVAAGLPYTEPVGFLFMPFSFQIFVCKISICNLDVQHILYLKIRRVSRNVIGRKLTETTFTLICVKELISRLTIYQDL